MPSEQAKKEAKAFAFQLRYLGFLKDKVRAVARKLCKNQDPDAIMSKEPPLPNFLIDLEQHPTRLAFVLNNPQTHTWLDFKEAVLGEYLVKLYEIFYDQFAALNPRDVLPNESDGQIIELVESGALRSYAEICFAYGLLNLLENIDQVKGFTK